MQIYRTSANKVGGIKWTLDNGDQLEFGNTYSLNGAYEAVQPLYGKVVGIVLEKVDNNALVID